MERNDILDKSPSIQKIDYENKVFREGKTHRVYPEWANDPKANQRVFNAFMKANKNLEKDLNPYIKK